MKRKLNIPFKQQMADADCGPACLAMILGTYGHHLSVYASRQLCERVGQPQSLRTLVLVARALGMHANMVAADLHTLEQVPMPCIVHWNFNHFVVLERERHGTFWICDPAFGRRRVSSEEFSASFTGIVAQLEPGERFKPKRRDPNLQFRQFTLSALKQARALRFVAWTLGVALAIQILSLLSPLLTVYIIDVVVAGNATAIHRLLLPVILSAAVSIGLLSGLRSRVIVSLQSVVDEVLLSGFVRHIVRLPAQFFLEKGVADIQSRMNSSTVIRDATSIYVVSTLLDVMTSFGYLIALTFVSPVFALLTGVLIVSQFLIYVIHMRAMRDRMAAEIKTQSMYQGYVYELLNGILTIKAASAEDRVETAWRRKLKNYLVASKERAMADGRLDAAISTMRIASPAILLWYSISEYFSHHLSLGTVLAINTIAVSALMPASSLIGTVRQFQFALTHSERIGDVWMHEPERSGGGAAPALDAGGVIRFENVSFRYKGSDDATLNDVSLDIPLGKKIGLVGPSGSGKSTLIHLLLGFQEPQEGHISVNGRLLGSVDLNDYRKRIGYVSQETFLFSSSVRNNVTLAAPDVTLESVTEVLSLAGLSDLIESMPMGLDSLLGNNGNAVSGGQRQRLAIARALLCSPELLVLDEATSSLDSQTETAVAKAIASQTGTQLIISHRLATLKACDIIYVLEKGVITGKGTHADLVENNAFYRSCSEYQSGAGRSLEYA